MSIIAAFTPHGHCYLWQTPLVGLHVLADGLIAIAYFSVPLALVRFVRQHQKLPFAQLFWLFSAFIVACGITHLLAIWTLWYPTYWLSGIIKAFTAWISLTTALYLIPLLPQMLALPSLSETRSLSQNLWQEMLDQQLVESFLRRYERIFATVEDGIVLLDAQGICQLANQTYLEWHQKRPYEVIDQPLKQVLGDQLYSQKIQPYLADCLAGKTKQSALWVEYPDLGRQFMSVSFVPYKETDGRTSGAIVALRNLTQLKETEAALFQSRATQRAILESLPDLLIHLNRDGIQLDLVHDDEFVLMDPEKTEVPASVYEVMPPELADLRMHHVHQALLHDRRQTYEHDIVIDGKLRHEETRVVKLNDWEAVLLVRDITDRKQKEAQLRCYERIVAASFDGIALVDRDYRYQIVNDTYLQYLGRSRNDIIGQPVKALLSVQTFAEKVKPWLDACLAGETIRFEHWISFPAMGPQFVRATYTPHYEADGTLTGCIVIINNLTSHQQVEQALKQSELQFRGIFEQMYQFVGLLTPDGTLVEANRAALEFGGVEIAEVRGRLFKDLNLWKFSSTSQKQLQESIERAAQGEFVRYEIEARGTHGRLVTLDFSLRPVFNEAEEVVWIIPEGRDITNRKRRESQLRRYERIVAASLDGMALIDCDYRYQIVNDTYLKYFGRSRDELIGQPASSVLGAQTFARKFRPGLDDCLGGETTQYETWIDFATVGKQLVRMTFSPYREADRTITGCIVIINNLTNLKRIEQALQESELRFRGIFEQMYQFVGLLTPDGTLVEANHAALEFGGARIADIRGRPLWELSLWKFSSANQEQLQEAIARAAQGEFVRHEIDVRGAQGQVVTLDFSLRPVFNDAGDVVWLIPEGRDITDRIQVEKNLRLQAVVTRNMAEGVCLIRVDNSIIVWANAKFERMFGYGLRELKGQHVSLINQPTADMTADEVRQAIQASVLTNREATYEVLNVKKDGTPFWCQATTSIFDHPDYGQVMVVIQQDISDRKADKTQLQESLREKELLLKEVYHRVKNNLQVIYSLLNLQGRSLAEPQAKAAIRDSQSRVAAMALVHEKLYQSKDLECIELADYVSGLAKSLFETYAMDMNDIQLAVDISACWLDIEKAIPCGLILTELIANSFKYAFPEGHKGKLTITSSSPLAHQITLVIQDDGVGLPAAIGFDSPRSLGLRLIQNLAKQLQGSIKRVPTTIGTEFQLTFPHQTGLINGKQ